MTKQTIALAQLAPDFCNLGAKSYRNSAHGKKTHLAFSTLKRETEWRAEGRTVTRVDRRGRGTRSRLPNFESEHWRQGIRLGSRESKEQTHSASAVGSESGLHSLSYGLLETTPVPGVIS